MPIPPRSGSSRRPPSPPPSLRSCTGRLGDVFRGAAGEALEAALPQFMTPRRWFGSKARAIRHVRISSRPSPSCPTAHLAIAAGGVRSRATSETYVLARRLCGGAGARALAEERPVGGDRDAADRRRSTASSTTRSGIPTSARRCWTPSARAGSIAAQSGDLVAVRRSRARLACGAMRAEPLPPVLLGVEQSNTSVRYGDRLILKLYRRLADRRQPRPGNRPVPHREGRVRQYSAAGRRAGVSPPGTCGRGADHRGAPARLCAQPGRRLALHPGFARRLLRRRRRRGPVAAAATWHCRRRSLLELVQGEIPVEAETTHRRLPGLGAAARPSHRRTPPGARVRLWTTRSLHLSRSPLSSRATCTGACAS